MKKTLFFSGTLALLLVACGPGRNEAIKYNDSLMEMIGKVNAPHEAFMSQIDGHNIDSLKITQLAFANSAQDGLAQSEKMEPFGENKDFRDAVVEYFSTLRSIATGEGKQMLDIMSKDSSQVTEADVEQVTSLAESFDSKYENVHNKVQSAQEKFAKEWKFNLEEKKE
jgi:hypothetical protein